MRLTFVLCHISWFQTLHEIWNDKRMHKMMIDLGNCKTHTNHCYLGILSGADCRDGKSDDQQFVHDDCSVDEHQPYESELRAINCSLVGVEVTDMTGN